MTPSIVPNNSGEGEVGVSFQPWSGGHFSHVLQVRGQDTVPKFFVADSGTRYALIGLAAPFRPQKLDLIYQFSPTGLFVVLDETLLSSESGYRQIGQTLTELFTNPTIYGTVNLASGSTGRVLYLDSGKNIAYSSVTSGELFYLSGCTGNIQSQFNGISTGYAALNSPVFVNKITTPQLYVTGITGSIVPYIDNSGQLTPSQVTIFNFNFVSGTTGNIQGQLNSLRSGLMTTGAWPVVMGTYTFPSGSGSSAFIQFGYTFGGLPKIFGSLRNNSSDPILGYEVSGIATSGFYLTLSAATISNNYRFDYFATTGSGFLNLGFSDPNVVYTTGNQTISGTKTFAGIIGVDSITARIDTDLHIDVLNRQLLDATPIPVLDWNVGMLSWNGGNSIDWANYLLLIGSNTALDWNNRVLSGNWKAQNFDAITIPLGTLTPTGSSGYIVSFLSGYQKITTNSGIMFSSGTNLTGVRSAVVKIDSSVSGRGVSFNSNWIFLGSTAPTGISSGKSCVLSLTAFGTGQADVFARFDTN